MVSLAADYGNPATGNVQVNQWTTTTWGEYQEILRRLAALDAKLSQPNCEDPSKLEWMKSVEKRLQSLEASAK
jgi:ATP-dependent Clp protease ATP-binding subunit ClpA